MRPQVVQLEPQWGLQDKVEQAIAVLQGLLDDGKHLVMAYSGGKDSSVMVAIGLEAIRRQVAAGRDCPRCVVMHGDTLLENPVVNQFSRTELKKMRTFSRDRGLPVSIEIVTPSMSENWLVSILGGRTIATVPGASAKCSMEMKVSPMRRAKRRLFREMGMDNVITLIGKRRDESAARAANMIERGESSQVPVPNEQGEWLLSAIAEFTLDDVFGFIGEVCSGRRPAYSDFEGLMQVYRAGNEDGACELVIQLTGRAGSTGCGNRFGCHICTKVGTDRSMENMLDSDDADYRFMAPLNTIRQYILDTHWDLSKRCWLSRSTLGGTIKLAPNAYSPDHCRDLLRYYLTADADEAEAAAALGIAPRFTVITPAMVLGIAFLQAKYGYTDGLDAVEQYQAVMERGERYYPPVVETPAPRSRFDDFEQLPFFDDEADALFNGLRDVEAAMVDAEITTVKSDGRVFAGGDGGEGFEVDAEGAAMFLAFEADWAIQRYFDAAVSPNAAVHYLLRLGAVSVYKGSHARLDQTLKLNAQIHRYGLRDVLNDPVALRARIIEGVRKNWTK